MLSWGVPVNYKIANFIFYNSANKLSVASNNEAADALCVSQIIQ